MLKTKEQVLFEIKAIDSKLEAAVRSIADLHRQKKDLLYALNEAKEFYILERKGSPYRRGFRNIKDTHAEEEQ